MVDIEARTIEAMSRNAQGQRVVVGIVGDEVAAIPPFEAVELDITRLFPPPPRP